MTEVGSSYFMLNLTSRLWLSFPMAKAQDLTGKRFGRLVAMKVDNSGRRRRWECLCDCGKTTMVEASLLNCGRTRSCGCLSVDHASSMNASHGMTGTKIYKAWKGIKKRCFNQSEKAYKNYGGRGITLCDEWVDDFPAFYAYIGDPPTDRHTVGRIDNEGDYRPGNVRWETYAEQNSNKRNNKVYEYKGSSYHLDELVAMSGVSWSTMASRLITLGWPVDKAVETPAGGNEKDPMVEYQGIEWTIGALSKHLNIDYYLLRRRIISGMTVEDAISKPIKKTKVGQLYTFNGQSRTITKWAKLANIGIATVHKRMSKHGWNFERAITTPVRGNPSTGMRL